MTLDDALALPGANSPPVVEYQQGLPWCISLVIQ
jgi:hypothetical protein